MNSWFQKVDRFLNKPIREIKNDSFRYFKANAFAQYFLVALGSFLLFAYLQNTPGMADPDSFYHIAMAQLIYEQGVPREFPYLPYTIFNTYFTDHHLLYHLVLIPFVKLLDPIVGAKLAQALMATLTVITFFWLLKRLKVPLSGFFTLILCLTSPFIFRVSLIKVPALSILVLLLAIQLIHEKKWPWLFGLAFFFVWLYGGFLLLVVATGIFVFVEGLLEGARAFGRARLASSAVVVRTRWFSDLHAWTGLLKKTAVVWFKPPVLFLWLAVILGVILGVVVNPYFPNNLTFYWEQVIQIGLINYQKVIGVGGEWYPYPIGELVSATAFVWMLVVAALTASVINWRRLTKESLALFFFALIFFVFTLKSRRYVEYFVPFTLLWTAVAMRDTLSNEMSWARISAGVSSFFKNQRVFATAATVYFLIAVPYLSFTYVHGTKNSLVGYPADKFAGAGEWLRENSKPGQIIFHNDWDDFPILFFHDPANYYIVGLDPTFMYKFDQALYWKWVNITIGKQADRLYQTIKKDFKASYVFVDSDHAALENNLKQDGHFTLVYSDTDTRIYSVP